MTTCSFLTCRQTATIRFYVTISSKMFAPKTQFNKILINVERLKEISKSLRKSEKFKNQAANDFDIESKGYQRVLRKFSSELSSDPSRLMTHDSALMDIITAIHDDKADIIELLPYFIDYTRRNHPMLFAMKHLKYISDLSEPCQWYPRAQMLDRKFILHLGPTNSGKTHSALKEFTSAGNGIYCSPLRMLAGEIYRKTNSMGVVCDLLTGEERLYGSGSEDDPAHHVACTVEMANLMPINAYDVAVIDEIQMITDPVRGGAWTRALLGVPAKCVHVCGEPTVYKLLKKIIHSIGGEVEVKNYQRLKPLVPLNYSLNGLFQNVRPGDCVVAFSRKRIFSIKQSIERETGQSCAVVYGGLPPATRSSQAELFNKVKRKVMVATDAIGMGLNLNIKRIVFHTLDKFDGKSFRTLSSSEVRQISGRAGRYGQDHARGEVTTFFPKNIPLLHELINSPVENMEKAGVSPSFEHIESFSVYLDDHTLPELLSIFLNTATVSKDFFLCKANIKQQMVLAKIVVKYDFNLRDSYTLSLAPVDTKKTAVINVYQKFLRSLSMNDCVSLTDLHRLIQWPVPSPKNHFQIEHLEESHEIVNLYLWLSQRFTHFFPDLEKAGELQEDIENMIGKSLQHRKRKHLIVSKKARKGKRTQNKQQLHIV